MAKPTNSIRGFIEITNSQGSSVLLALRNIAGVADRTGKAEITLVTRVSSFSQYSDTEIVNQSYETVLNLIREAV